MTSQTPGEGNADSLRPESRPAFGELAASAIRYWEPRRLAYNLVLLAVVMVHVMSRWPESRNFLTRDTLLGFFFLAVLANICYCAAYAIDLFVQFSGLREAWPRWRWVVLTTGIAFAAVIAHFFTMSALAAGGFH